MHPNELKAAIDGGLLSFPLTDFSTDDTVDVRSFRARLDWLGGFRAAGLFPAGGAGEFFSLRASEYRTIVAETIAWSAGRTPVIAAAGLGTHAAEEYAREAAALGADGILLLPPYMTEASQAGLIAHVERVCRSVEIGVIVYNRGNCRLAPDAVERLAHNCPNLIALKDGLGNVEWLLDMRSRLGDRLLLINGMPTAEVHAASHSAMGAPTYSSAIFNFVPKTAIAFHRAVRDGDSATRDRICRDFLLPYLALRNHQPGYAVSIVKAGVELIGRGAGPVRPPLSDLTTEERNELGRLIEAIEPGSIPEGSTNSVRKIA